MKRIPLNPDIRANGIKPFLADAYEVGIVKDGEVLSVSKVKESNSKAGWSIHTESCIVFLFKSSPVCDVVIELLSELVKKNPAEAMLIEIDANEAAGFHLGLSDEAEWLWVKQKKLGSTTVFTCQPAGRASHGRKTLTGK